MVEETEETDSIVQPKKLPLIDVSELTQFAIDSYSETPKFMTIVRHADDVDHSLFFCVKIEQVIDPHSKKPVLVWSKKEFVVPRQRLCLYHSHGCNTYVAVEVMRGSQEKFWLIADCINRTGILVPYEKFNQEQY
jgi:hypothetical protein